MGFWFCGYHLSDFDVISFFIEHRDLFVDISIRLAGVNSQSIRRHFTYDNIFEFEV